MNYPTNEQIEIYLKEAKINNQGPWDHHARFAGQAAKLIAEKAGMMDPELAFAMGSLHDIGRREGFSHMHHVIAGYEFMMAEGYDQIARICLTHSFPAQALEEYIGETDCSDQELSFLKGYLQSVTYDDYDRLIQLCDALSLTTGYCLMEKRLVDVAMRYGLKPEMQIKWKAYFDIKDYFEDRIGGSIYNLLPGVAENTFR